MKSLLLPAVALALFTSHDLFAQQAPRTTPSRPKLDQTVLYPGENTITLTAPGGIRDVKITTTGPVRITEGEGSGSGETTRRLGFDVGTASQPIDVLIEMTDGNGVTTRKHLELDIEWKLDRIDLGSVRQGETICHEFSLRSKGRELREITVGDPRISLELTRPLPSRARRYSYNVCVRADAPAGTYKFPVTLWIARPTPDGGTATYPVADTGVVTILAVDQPVTDQALGDPLVVGSAPDFQRRLDNPLDPTVPAAGREPIEAAPLREKGIE